MQINKELVYADHVQKGKLLSGAAAGVATVLQELMEDRPEWFSDYHMNALLEAVDSCSELASQRFEAIERLMKAGL